MPIQAQLGHPQPDALEAFGLGKLDEQEAARVEQHLAECPACCETLLAMQDDTFVELVRVAETPATENVEATTRTNPAWSRSAGDVVPPSLPAELADHPRYRVLELLGRGGMGDVYKAEHRLLNRLVAIKIINRRWMKDAHAVVRFRREAQAAARLAHPNIVAAYDAEQAGDLHFLAMEYIAGINLAQHVQHHGPMPVAAACECIRQVAEALQHAHERGMVHRDIKPQNLMLEELRIADCGSRNEKESSQSAIRSPQSAIVKVLDFGLARFAAEAADHADGPVGLAGPTEARLTLCGATMGTPDYIAPEQSRSARDADIRSDIYSLGCTLYFLLAGRPPFPEGSADEKLHAHAHRRPRPLAEWRRDLPPGLETVVARMMAKDPRDRYQRPAEVAAALAPFAASSVGRTFPPVTTEGKRDVFDGHECPSSAAVQRRAWPRALMIVVAVVMLFFGVVFYVKLGETTVKFEIDDPSLAVRFGNNEITIDNGGRPIRITPGEKQTVTVLQDGLEVQTAAFTLRKGDKEIIRVGIEEGEVAITSGNRDMALETGPRGSAPSKPADSIVIQAQDSFPGELATRRPWSMSISGDRKTLVTQNEEGMVAVWDAVGKRMAASWKAPLAAAFAVSSDGRRVVFAVGGWGSKEATRIFLVEAATGKQLRQIHDVALMATSMAFSPDDQWLLVGGAADAEADVDAEPGPALRLWRVATGEEVKSLEVPQFLIAPREDHRWVTVRDVAFSPDGKHFAAVGGVEQRDKSHVQRVRRRGYLWETETGRLVHEWTTEAEFVTQVAFTPDSRFVITGDTNAPSLEDHTPWVKETSLRLWDVATGERVRALTTRAETVFDLDISPDGKVAVVATAGGVRVWGLSGGREVARSEIFPRREQTPWRRVAFLADSRSFVTGGTDGLKLWRLPDEIAAANHGAAANIRESAPAAGVATMEPAETFVGEHVDGVAPLGQGIGAFAIAADRRTAYVGHTPGEAAVVDLETKREVVAWKTTLMSPTAMSVSGDGRIVAMGGSAGGFEIWDARKGERLRTLEGTGAHLRSLALSPEGNLLVFGAMQRIYSSGKESLVIDEPAFGILSTQPGESEVGLWMGPRLLNRPFSKHDRIDVDAVRFSPSGRRLAIVGDVMHYGAGASMSIEDFFFVWDMQAEQPREVGDAGQGIRRFERVKTHATTVVFTPDEKLLVTGHAGRNVESCVLRVWDVESGRVVREMCGHEAPIVSLDVSPDGKLAASLDGDGSLRVWRLVDGREIARHEERREASSARPRSHVAFRADSRSLVTAGVEGMKLWPLWDMAVTDSQASASQPPATPELDELVRLAEEGVHRVTMQFKAGIVPKGELIDAKIILLEARLRRSLAWGEQLTPMGLLQELVKIREEQVADVRQMFEAGVVTDAALREAQQSLVETKLRLNEAEASFP